MLSFLDMEDYFNALQAIAEYEEMISRTTHIRTVRFDSIAGGRVYRPDTIGGIIAAKDAQSEDLARLRRYTDRLRPEVEKTIAATVSGMRGSTAIKTELALKLHYLSGREWVEIGDLLHTDAAQISEKARQCITEIQTGGRLL